MFWSLLHFKSMSYFTVVFVVLCSICLMVWIVIKIGQWILNNRGESYTNHSPKCTFSEDTKTHDGMSESSQLLSELLDEKKSTSELSLAQKQIVKTKIKEYLRQYQLHYNDYDSMYVFKENRKSELVLVPRLQALLKALSQ